MKDWPIYRLGDICRTSSGGTPLKGRAEYYESGTIPWLLSGEVNQGEVWVSSRFITPAGLENSSAKVFPVDTVLVAMYGATAGQVGLLKFEAATNQAVCGVLPNARLTPRYMYYLLCSRKEDLVAQAVGNAQPNISQQKIRDLKLSIPPLPEQQRIVGILDKAFAAIATARANAEKNLLNARALFESHLQSVFTQREGWVEKPLADLCDIKHGFAFKSEFFSDRGDYVLLTPGNFYEEGGYRDRFEKQKFYNGEIPADYVLAKGDLLIAMTEQAAGLLGSSILIPESRKFLHNQRLGLVTPKPNVPWISEFFFRVFNTRTVRKTIHDSASGVKVRHTSPTKVGAVRIAFPPSTQAQRTVVAGLASIEKETRHLESHYQQKLTALDELKKSILHQAFTGEL